MQSGGTNFKIKYIFQKTKDDNHLIIFRASFLCNEYTSSSSHNSGSIGTNLKTPIGALTKSVLLAFRCLFILLLKSSTFMSSTNETSYLACSPFVFPFASLRFLRFGILMQHKCLIQRNHCSQ
ncbi:unnamed protein product [Cuscuta epithymum]|uniref:Uncharacterized protein n=1 Tax=Cuscuta epithymum TaxID=186058 RepID=A0AAV0G6K1_9ASTE|nr:unnamed protein product [Cuscuta epithymum]